MRRKWLRNSGILVFLLAGLATGQTIDPIVEYQVKAAFILNFTKFIEWPPDAFGGADSPLTICVLGKDPFGRTLDGTIQGEVVNGRRLAVQRISQMSAVRACQIVFVGGGEKDLPKTLGSLGRGVLTIGDSERFLREGGMIALVVDNRRVRFDVNQTAAMNGGLNISSRLLNLARSVEK